MISFKSSVLRYHLVSDFLFLTVLPYKFLDVILAMMTTIKATIPCHTHIEEVYVFWKIHII